MVRVMDPIYLYVVRVEERKENQVSFPNADGGTRRTTGLEKYTGPKGPIHRQMCRGPQSMPRSWSR